MNRNRLLLVLAGRALMIALLWPGAVRTGHAQVYNIAGPYPRITSPANHAAFYAPLDLPLDATAIRTNLEFFAGTNDLGTGVELPPPIYLWVTEETVDAHNFRLTWTNPPPGSYMLTAVTSAMGGNSRTSPPVNITIMSAPPNPVPTVPDIVTIVATDPIAIAGTNACVWPGETNATPTWTNWPPPVWQSFTNWGPQNALFTVRRLGALSNSLTVNFNITGTASNGMDYEFLTNSVTLPAGYVAALIPIVPLDNRPTNVARTVVLTLIPDTSLPPNYVPGTPSRAAAIILEDWPRPLPYLLSDGSFHLNASGPDGAWFYVQYTTDLINWSTLCTNQVFQGSVDFIDPDAATSPGRFYRPVPLAGPPAD